MKGKLAALQNTLADRCVLRLRVLFFRGQSEGSNQSTSGGCTSFFLHCWLRYIFYPANKSIKVGILVWQWPRSSGAWREVKTICRITWLFCALTLYFLITSSERRRDIWHMKNVYSDEGLLDTGAFSLFQGSQPCKLNAFLCDFLNLIFLCF